MPEILQPVTPTQAPASDANQNQQTPVKTDDLIARASQVKLDNKTQQSQTSGDDSFDFKNIEAIKDPIAKEQAMSAYKSFQKGFNQKFQELAEQRKTLDKQLNEISNWTPEKVQNLLNRTDFVQSAQAILGTQNPKNSGVSDEEFSNLTESEKVQLSEMKSKINQFEQQNQALQREKENSQLKERYSNYNAEVVNGLFNDMMSGKIKATNEHLWKVVDYDDAVNRAYQLGLQDKNINNTEKANAMTTIGNGVNISSDKPVKAEKESGSDYLGRLIQWNRQNTRKG